MSGVGSGTRQRWLVAACGLLAVAVAACGGGDDSNGGDNGADDGGGKTPVPAASATAKPLSPDELGDKIAADYVKMLSEATALLAGQPAAEVLRPQLTALKDKYVEVFVTYGRRREAMGTADREKVDAAIRKALFAAPTTAIGPFNDASARFQKTDPDLSQTIVSLNILTQYANFDLLKKQEPKEAERLGIK